MCLFLPVLQRRVILGRQQYIIKSHSKMTANITTIQITIDGSTDESDESSTLSE